MNGDGNWSFTASRAIEILAEKVTVRTQEDAMRLRPLYNLSCVLSATARKTFHAKDQLYMYICTLYWSYEGVKRTYKAYINYTLPVI